jgi:hypothetical protein
MQRRWMSIAKELLLWSLIAAFLLALTWGAFIIAASESAYKQSVGYPVHTERPVP